MTASHDRRREVLESALDTFARRGYRSTSMEEVARRARISRPGLYLYFASKQELLRAAVEHALERDATRCESALRREGVALRVRLLEALDLWSGQYVGPFGADLDRLLEQDASLLGDMPDRYSTRFSSALTNALTEGLGPDQTEADSVREVLLALSTGLKYRAADREEFRAILDTALRRMFR